MFSLSSFTRLAPRTKLPVAAFYDSTSRIPRVMIGISVTRDDLQATSQHQQSLD